MAPRTWDRRRRRAGNPKEPRNIFETMTVMMVGTLSSSSISSSIIFYYSRQEEE
jgi:hypothetical protein